MNLLKQTRTLLLICALFTLKFSYSQNESFNQNIYFDFAKKTLSSNNMKQLDRIADTLKSFETYRITLNGYTDNVGNDATNIRISQRRIDAAMDYLLKKNIQKSLIDTKAYGEENPLADNNTAEGRQKNRRVEVIISYAPAKNNLVSIQELYKKTEMIPQSFEIISGRDTTLRCQNGTVLYVKANAFTLTESCNSGKVKINVKEPFYKSDMILENLATTSDKMPLETQGILFVEAMDCNGKQLAMNGGNDLVLYIPTGSITPKTKIFSGERGLDTSMNWAANNYPTFSNFTLDELNACEYWYCGGVHYDCERCRFFFCRIGRIGKGIKGTFNKEAHQQNKYFRACQRKLRKEIRLAKKSPELTVPTQTVYNERPTLAPDLLPICQDLEELFNKYGINNRYELVSALNKMQMDSFDVKSMIELRDTLRKLKVRNTELSLLNKKVPYLDFAYYVFNTSRLGWRSIDCFDEYADSQLTKIIIDLKPEINNDCKIIFKKRRVILPAGNNKNSYILSNIPANEEAWIVAIKYEDGKSFLSMEEVKLENKTYKVNLKEVSLEELKQQLKALDEN